MKICNTCNVEKSLDDFYFRKDSNSYRNTCKNCFNNKCKSNRENNIERNKEYGKQYRLNNADKCKDYHTQYYIDNSEKIKSKSTNYYQNNKSKRKEYLTKNESILLEAQRKRYKYRMENDPLFKSKENVRKLIQISFKRNLFKKESTTNEILGCSYIEFKTYIESKFEPWMNWENYGLYNGTENYGWDLDHIVPTHTATSESEITLLNHYTNFQPLCSYVNRILKRGKTLF